jgi:hypothetical protein
MVSTTPVVPLPAATCGELSGQLLARGQPAIVRVTGFGKVPEDGTTLRLYVADCPAMTVCGPEVLLIAKLNPPMTVTGRFCVCVVKPGDAA